MDPAYAAHDTLRDHLPKPMDMRMPSFDGVSFSFQRPPLPKERHPSSGPLVLAPWSENQGPKTPKAGFPFGDPAFDELRLVRR